MASAAMTSKRSMNHHREVYSLPGAVGILLVAIVAVWLDRCKRVGKEAARVVYELVLGCERLSLGDGEGANDLMP
jgi:hypothetical protein